MASGARLREPFSFLAPPDRSRGGGPTSSPHSVLFHELGENLAKDVPPPSFFTDLRLDDIVAASTAGHRAGGLAPVYYRPLHDVRAIEYRHDVFRDLESPPLLEAIDRFCDEMERVHRWLGHAARTTYAFDRERWLLGAASDYVAAVRELNAALATEEIQSAGLAGIRDHVAAYVESEPFATLDADSRRVSGVIEGISYRVRIHGPKVTVTPIASEPDLSAEVLATFEKFRQGPRRTYDWKFELGSDMNHVEAAILDLVARLYPEPFAILHRYAEHHREFLDETLARFDREVRFYLAYHDFMVGLARGGLQFCYPEVTDGSHRLEGRRIFDLALAASLVGEKRQVVPNDAELRDGERVIVVSGPNQGGKTTFARAIGQLAHLSRIGVPVPGERLRIPLFDQVFTHFEQVEQIEDLSSKLENDLRRIHEILEAATARSLLIMNESFSSTTVVDQLHIGRRIMRQLLDRGLLCVMVTFLDELAGIGPAIVSMLSSIDPRDEARRTYEIMRRPPDGLAYALAIAEKHRLTYPRMSERLRS